LNYLNIIPRTKW